MRLTRQPPSTPEKAREMEEKVRAAELTISLVLRIGVTVSVAIFLVGLVVIFVHHPSFATFSGSLSYHTLTDSGAQFPHSVAAVVSSLRAGEGRGIIVLGAVVLILTPILRVVVAMVSFAIEKDPAMTLVTLYVLLVLVASFFLAGI